MLKGFYNRRIVATAQTRPLVVKNNMELVFLATGHGGDARNYE
jgi:hypothetical protein